MMLFQVNKYQINIK